MKATSLALAALFALAACSDDVSSSITQPSVAATSTVTIAVTISTTPVTTTPTTAPPTTAVPRMTVERTTTTTLPAFSIEEISAAIVPPLNAWLAAPSGPGVDALAVAAQQLLDSGRVANPSVQEQLELMAVYPGRNWMVAIAGQYLALNQGMAGVPAMIRGGGTVGVDVLPGRYRTMDPVEGCYRETLDDAVEINDNNFVSAAPQVIMTVRSSDFAVNVEDCGVWVMI